MGWQTLWVRSLAPPKTTQAAEASPLPKPLLPTALRFAQSELGGKILAKLDAGQERKPPFVIENKYFRVEASQVDGTLTITDKNSKTVYSGLNRFVDGGDAGDEYNYSPPNKDSFHTPNLVALTVFRAALIPALEIEYSLELPVELSPDRKSRSQKVVSIPILSRISLTPGVPRIDIHTQIDNTAKDHRLRVHFPAPFAVAHADYDGHFEVVQRLVGVSEKGEDWVEDPRPEVPQRAFTNVSNGKIGLMIANRGLPEVEVLSSDGQHSEVALTLLRSVGWLSRGDMPVREGHAGPGLETPGGQVTGKWNYDYAIIPHQGTWEKTYQQAYGFESPLRAIETGLHDGDIPITGSFIAHTPAEFIISTVKETEDGKGWILRGYNISDEPIQLNLKPLQKFAHAARVNLAEEVISVLNKDKEGNIEISVSGHEVVSIRFNN
jgi:alpha-mannosidase